MPERLTPERMQDMRMGELLAEIDALRAERDAYKAALSPIVKFLNAWDAHPVNGISDEFYAIHGGDACRDGASLRLSELRTLRALARDETPHV